MKRIDGNDTREAKSAFDLILCCFRRSVSSVFRLLLWLLLWLLLFAVAVSVRAYFAPSVTSVSYSRPRHRVGVRAVLSVRRQAAAMSESHDSQNGQPRSA